MVDVGEYTDTSPMDGMGIASFLLQKMIQPAAWWASGAEGRGAAQYIYIYIMYI